MLSTSVVALAIALGPGGGGVGGQVPGPPTVFVIAAADTLQAPTPRHDGGVPRAAGGEPLGHAVRTASEALRPWEFGPHLSLEPSSDGERHGPPWSMPPVAGPAPVLQEVVGPGAVYPQDPPGAALLPRFDRWVAEHARSERIQGQAAISGAARVLRSLALPGTLLLASALYAGGHLGGDQELERLGMHTGQAVVAAGAMTLGGKVVAGRARPRVSPGDPADFGFGRGLATDDYQSFPSAHTAAAFAASAVLVPSLPGGGSVHRPWVPVSIYAGAALMGASRMYHDEHWATDVVSGAAIGLLSGWGVRRYHAARDGP